MRPGAGLARGAAMVTAAVLLAGCGSLPVSQQYLGDSAYGAFLAVPAEYAKLSPAQLGADAVEGTYLEGFAGPGVSVDQLFWGPSPAGVQRVLIVEGDIDAAKKAAENAFLADLRGDVAAGRAEFLAEPAVVDEDDVSLTVEMQVRVTGPAGAEPGVVRVRTVIGKGSASGQVGPEAHVVKTLVIGCAESCFSAQRDVIGTVVQNWKVS